MELRTRYLGLDLKNPLVVSASPLVKEIDNAKRLEDAGASAVVMYSLFEEQITHDQHALDHFLTTSASHYAEALSYFPEPEHYTNSNGEAYLAHLAKLKSALSIPVIGSLNGVSPGGWIKYAKHMQDAGADAIELNIYYMATSFELTSETVEQMYVADVEAVKKAVTIPVAIKLGPYFSAFANFAARLDRAGADGLVLFNRFLGPDIDLKSLEVAPHLQLSTNWEMRLPLRWIAVLYGRIKASLAATTGAKTYQDVLKFAMAGADVTMMASVLLERGPTHIAEMLVGMREWLDENEYDSLQQLKGSMSHRCVAEPAAYERANYMKALQSYR
jgi:dihydroorotate dehydrogenase (fumarate)